MCLDTITQGIDSPGEVKCWKLFSPESQVRSGPVGLVFYHRFKLDEWDEDERNLTLGDIPGVTYPSGYHGFDTREGAEWWAEELHWFSYCLCEVTLRGVHTVGEQEGEKVYVGREIFISYEDWEKRLIVMGEGEQNVELTGNLGSEQSRAPV